MKRYVFKSKIHRATVTGGDLNYEGSLTIDEDLLWDVTNGSRLITYALKGPRGSGIIQVNGGGAHHIKPGDIVIIATFTQLQTKKARKHEPIVVFVDGQNRIRLKDESPPSAPLAEPAKPKKKPQ
jgi:aspartate 1-decarboxylase